MDENLTEVRYQFYSLKFTPLNGVNKTSKDIVFDIVTFISNKLFQERQGYLIDKHHAQRNKRREIFMDRAVILARERRLRCSMALLRNKNPLIKPHEEFKLVPISDMGSVAEQTNFFIDYSRDPVIICCEYHHEGPRISDIEYYFRNIAHRELRLSKATKIEAFFDRPIEEVLAKMKNVLSFTMKVDPRDLNRLTNDVHNQYFTGMRSLSNMMEPRFLRIEALFQSPGSKFKSKAINTKANNVVKDLLTKIKGSKIDIDTFKDFRFEYEDKDGIEEVFNLLSGKKEIVLNVDLSQRISSTKWYELIKNDFDDFMQNL